MRSCLLAFRQSVAANFRSRRRGRWATRGVRLEAHLDARYWKQQLRKEQKWIRLANDWAFEIDCKRIEKTKVLGGFIGFSEENETNYPFGARSTGDRMMEGEEG